MAKKKSSTNPYRDDESPQYAIRRSKSPAGLGAGAAQYAKLQKKADAMGYATASRGKSPSASTRERTATKTLLKEFKKPLSAKSVLTLTPERKKQLDSKNVGVKKQNRKKRIK